MQKNAIIAIAAVLVVVVAGAGVAVTLKGDDGKEPTEFNDAGIRLRIFGNANGDDVIDNKDVETINKIIDEKISDWKVDYYFADADHNGKIDSNDVDVVNKIINKESTKMWYETAFSTKDRINQPNARLDAYVNYPIGQKVGCEYSDIDALSILGKYDCLKATSLTAQADYGDKLYPGISTLPVLGEKDKLTMEGIAKLVDDSTIDTLIQWTGGTSTNYLWDEAVKCGLADKVSIVMVTIQGEHCIDGALMLGCMFGDQELAKPYATWYGEAMTKLAKITDNVKKTCIVMKTFNPDKLDNCSAYKQYQSPALWFSKIINFTPETAGTTGFYSLGSAEAITAAMGDTDFVICQTKHTPKVTNQEEYNTWCAAKLESIFKNLPVYENKKIYTIDFSIMPFFGGPAGCMLLAAQIYPDLVSLEDAKTMVDNYCSQFMPAGANTANGMAWGYTYTGWWSE